MRKHLRYAGYILRHKWFVFLECAKRGLWWRGLMHDMSKLRPSEWTAYVECFYGQHGDSNYRVKEDFDRAWLLHQHRNPHHWQYWVLKEDDGGTKTLPMPSAYRTEMLCDWLGAGRAITGKVGVNAWYNKNKDLMKLHPATKNWIEWELVELP